MAASFVKGTELQSLASLQSLDKLPTSIQISLHALLKMLYYTREYKDSQVTGQLLGMENDSVLDITDMAPFAIANDEAEQEDYQMDLLKSLKDVHFDHNTVGWFTTTSLEGFANSSMLETQLDYQVGIPGAVVLVVDVHRSSVGLPCISAYRLSSAALSSLKDKKSKSAMYGPHLFQEFPISVTVSSLDAMFLAKTVERGNLPLVGSASMPSIDLCISSIMTRSLLSTSDEMISEVGRLQHFAKSILKQQQSLSSGLQRLKNDFTNRPSSAIDEESAVQSLMSSFRPSSEPFRIPLVLACKNMHYILENSH